MIPVLRLGDDEKLKHYQRSLEEEETRHLETGVIEEEIISHVTDVARLSCVHCSVSFVQILAMANNSLTWPQTGS